MDVLSLAKRLIEQPSITPDDAGCQPILCRLLAADGFDIVDLPCGPVSNFWAVHGQTGPLLVFAGHTDVVDPGALEAWQYPPFQSVIDDTHLCGRGTQDMKSAVAAMVTAACNFVRQFPTHHGRIGLLITSAEEGRFYQQGTPHVIDYLNKQGEHIDWCLVGEPSCQSRLGDTIRNGRRGSLKCLLRVMGKQGHVAYPHLADNPIHRLAPLLNALVNISWCNGNEHFPPTVMQCAYVDTPTKVMNVVPAYCELGISFRYSTATNHTEIARTLESLLAKYHVTASCEWEHSGLPFLTESSPLLSAAEAAIQAHCHIQPTLSTAGGTSDGRFIAPTGAKVIELGTCNNTIHKINERVKIDEVTGLETLYFDIMKRLLTTC